MAMQCLSHVELVFFFKKKTAYEMRISDWSSDVCSSDLLEPDNEAYFGAPDNGMYADENGMPLESEPGTETDMPAEPAEQTPATTTCPRPAQKWIADALGLATPRPHPRSGRQRHPTAPPVPTPSRPSPLSTGDGVYYPF